MADAAADIMEIGVNGTFHYWKQEVYQGTRVSAQNFKGFFCVCRKSVKYFTSKAWKVN